MLKMEDVQENLPGFLQWKSVSINMLDRLKPISGRFNELTERYQVLRDLIQLEHLEEKGSEKERDEIYCEIDKIKIVKFVLSEAESMALECFQRAIFIYCSTSDFGCRASTLQIDNILDRIKKAFEEGEFGALLSHLQYFDWSPFGYDSNFEKVEKCFQPIELVKRICLLVPVSAEHKYYIETGEAQFLEAAIARKDDRSLIDSHFEELALKFIVAIRAKNLEDAFKLSRKHPEVFDYIQSEIHSNQKIFEAVFNEEIIVIADVGEKLSDAGHVYIGLAQTDGSMFWKGFYGKNKGIGQFIGQGLVKDDKDRVRLHHIEKAIKITAENYKKVLELMKKLDENESDEIYSFLSIPFSKIGNCCNFVDKVLILSGISNGLSGVFTFMELNKLHGGKSFSAVKAHLAWAYILDKPIIEDTDDSEITSLAVTEALLERAREAKRKAEYETAVMGVSHFIDAALSLMKTKPLIFSFEQSTVSKDDRISESKTLLKSKKIGFQ